MKKALGIIFNIFWIIFVGIESVIVSAVTGALCCVTLVGIPFGLQHFKFIPLAFAPAGKVVVARANKRPVLNFLWLIFGGFTSMLYFLLLGLFFTCTIVGYPIAVQLFKIANFCAAPFGAEILVEGKYSSTKDTSYDKNVVATRILENPDKTIDTPTGASTTTRNYLLSFRDAKFIENEKKFKMTRFFCAVLAILVPVVLLAGVVAIQCGFAEMLYLKIFPDTSTYNPIASYIHIFISNDSPLLLLSAAFLILMMAEASILRKFTSAKNALFARVLSPGNIQWLINCYPDDTDIKRFFYASPEKMLKKLNVALSRNASPTPIVIDELNFSIDNDEENDVLCAAGAESEESGELEAPVESPKVTEPTAEAQPETVIEPVIETEPIQQAEITAEVESETIAEEEPEAEIVTEIEATVETAAETDTEIIAEVEAEAAPEAEVESEIIAEANELVAEAEEIEEKTDSDETANV